MYSDRASINYYDVIIIIATIVKVLQSCAQARGVRSTGRALSLFIYGVILKKQAL